MLAAIGYISLACATSFALGLYFSQTVKDWVKGIPAALRADLKKAEGDALAKFNTAVTKAPTVSAPVPPAAPAVVEPAPAPTPVPPVALAA